jgi:hypothetical protein
MSTTIRPAEAVPREGSANAAARRVVTRVRTAWRRSVVLRGAAVAPAVLCAAALALLVLDLLAPLPAGWRLGLRWLPLAGFVGAVAAMVARAFFLAPGDRRLALLAEELVPALGNRLVTVLERGDVAPDGVVGRAFEADAARRLAAVDLRGIAPARVRGPLAALSLSAAALALFALAFPAQAREAWERWTDPRDAYEGAWREARARVLPAVPEPPVPGFDELRWRVVPPAYAGLPPAEGRGDEPVSALPGSRVELRSRFAPRWSAVRASRVGGGALPAVRRGGEWTVAWTMGAEERGISLEALAGDSVADRRVVPLVVLADRPPDVTLAAPEADLVLPAATGTLVVRATASDDHGVGDFRLTWVRSRGSGESFEFTEGEWAWGSVRREGRTVTGERGIDLATLGLQPGDVIHLRAVARDRNDVTGPGESVSRTRVVRIARESELDQITDVLALPTDLPKDPVLSQRMILLMTEQLRHRAPSLTPAERMEEAGRIALQQGRLRERIGEQIFTRSTEAMQGPEAHVGFEEKEGAHEHTGEEGSEPVLERASEATGKGTREEVEHRHDEGAVVDVNRTLLAIYNFMWSSERALNSGDPAAAIPPQHEALRLIQSTRAAERVFARGNVRVDPVDMAAARGEGKTDEASPAPRPAAAALPSGAPLLAEVDRASALLGARAPRDASLTLSSLAARALGDPAADRGAAALLSRAASAAGAGRVAEARRLLARARVLLAPSAGLAVPSLPSGADPAAADYFRRLGRGGAP